MDIQLDDCSLTYPGGHRAIDAVNMVIPSGQICVILGTSGAGKSTLLRMINGLATPTLGRVVLGSTIVTAANARVVRRRVATVRQDLGLVARSSVAVNIVAGAVADMPIWRVLLGLPSAAHRARACALAAAVGLDPEHMGHRAERLSGGQQQRVAIARALMPGAAVILVDEPVASLDPVTARAMLALLRNEARRSGATMVCTLHQPDLVMDFADRVIGLDRGRLVLDMPIAEFSARDTAVFYRKTALAPLAICGFAA
ncbi:MAG: ATP-binding cassette domain-containing protein [Sphingomonas sp.]